MIRFADPRGYAEFGVTTNFSFLRGASHPEEFVASAIALGLAGIGVADRNSLAGIVRAHLFLRDNKAEARGLRFVPGVRLVFRDGTPDILAYPRDRAAHGRLCRLLTRGNIRAAKGGCLLALEDLLEYQAGQQLILLAASSFEPETEAREARAGQADFAAPPIGAPETQFSSPETPSFPETASSPETAGSPIERLAAAAPGRLWIGATMTHDQSPRGDLAKRRRLGQRLGLPLIATSDALMHDSARRPLQDVLTCIRHGVTLETAGRRLRPNAERHLKPPDAMSRLFAEAPEALAETLRFLDGLDFSLDQLANDYPHELREGFATPQDALAHFAHEGAARRYPQGVPDQVSAALAHELDLVARLDYAPYFLSVHDIVRFARGREILCQGRGSAANSTLCYCLGITEVDPIFHDLLFERFISVDRREPPDIDVDFEHDRREEVIQYVYARYGRERAALTATVITYRARSAIRDVGKVFGLSEDALTAITSKIWRFSSDSIEAEEARRAGLDPSEPHLAQAIALARELAGFPRHLSQHTGGFVITHSRLDEVVPIANAAMEARTTIEWDKDDLDALGILKIDILALGMLSCLRKGFDLLRAHYGRAETLASLPREDPRVYAMIQKADTIGVFQIESRAQMSMLPRLKPEKFYDLVIEVAIVRPGPIQGDMVHPYLRRRRGREPVVYPSPELEAVLGKTLGVPLFQEQAMKIAIVAAGFTPSEADQLRRAMATFKKVGTIGTFLDKMVKGMVARGYTEDFATRCFKQIEGFGTYGFPESHAASFALLVYASCWMKCRYPDAFACALLNAQPMGFYAPAQIIRDAREHGIAVAEVDVNHSDWDSTLFALEGPDALGIERPPVHARHAERAGDRIATHAIRLGFRQVNGLSEDAIRRLVARRGAGYDSIRDLWLRATLTPAVLERLAEADAFRSLGLDRRDALWIVRGLNRAGDKDDLPLLRALSVAEIEPDANLPPMPLGQHVVEDYRHLSLSLKAHPIAFLRARLEKGGVIPARDLLGHPANQRVRVAGLILVRQRPGSAKGTVFLTIEDETGIANIIVWPRVFEALRPIVIGARCIAVTGRLQREGEVLHVVAEKAQDLSRLLGQLSAMGPTIGAIARADEVKRPILAPRERFAEQAPRLFDLDMTDEAAAARRVMPKGRNFQ
jgi:error-prone DNA polymerase